MYKEAASLGIDLMGYDSNDSAIKRRNRRKAVVLLGTGQSVPEKLKKRLIKKDIPQSGKKKISVKKCGQIILLVLQGRVCRQECSIRLESVATFVRKTISSLGWKRYLWFAKYISKGGENLEARMLKAEAEICCSTAPFYN